MLQHDDFQRVVTVVVDAAKEEILGRFNRVQAELKADGSLVTSADLAMQAAVKKALLWYWPNSAVLGEEMSAEEQQRTLDENREGLLWCLDPLDGTSNFSAGLPYFSVSLALLYKSKVVFGLVYDPARDECFTAIRGDGAYLNGHALVRKAPPKELKHCLAAVDFKRLNNDLRMRFAQKPPYGSQRSLGSIALDWCWLAAGRFHVYLHGKQKLWDYTAGHLILSEHQGVSTTLSGDEVFRYSLTPQSALAAVDAQLFEQWRAYLS